MKEQKNKYYVALLTIVCFLMGSFGFLFFCIGDAQFFLIQAALWCLIAFAYKYVKGKFLEEEWEENIIFTGLILPFLVGNFISIILMGSA